MGEKLNTKEARERYCDELELSLDPAAVEPVVESLYRQRGIMEEVQQTLPFLPGILNLTLLAIPDWLEFCKEQTVHANFEMEDGTNPKFTCSPVDSQGPHYLYSVRISPISPISPTPETPYSLVTIKGDVHPGESLVQLSYTVRVDTDANSQRLTNMTLTPDVYPGTYIYISETDDDVLEMGGKLRIETEVPPNTKTTNLGEVRLQQKTVYEWDFRWSDNTNDADT